MIKQIFSLFVLFALLLLLASGLSAEETKKDGYVSMMKEVNRLLTEKKISNAVAMLENSLDKYPEKNYRILFNLVWLYWQENNFDKMMNCYSRGHEKGYYFPIWLGVDPWKKNFETNKHFQKIIKKNNELLAKANIDSKPGYEVLLPEGYSKEKKYPVIILLHGWTESNKHYGRVWTSEIIKKNVISGFLRSSQIVGMNAYGWDNVKKARQEVKEFYNHIKSKYSVDEDKVIIGGFSQGGKTAIGIALHQVIPVSGFIANAPGGGLPEGVTDDSIKLVKDKNLKGIIFAGRKDHQAEEQKVLEKFLLEKKLSVNFIWLDKMVHGYPKDFSTGLNNAVKTILEKIK